jgi:hypothetical protein
MRSRVLARRILLVPVIGLAFIPAACSSSSNSTNASPPASSSPAAPSTTGSGGSGSGSPGSGSSATSAIKTNWEEFFNGKSSAATKISLLQNGQKFASVINAQAGTGLAASATATVTAVVVESSTLATVSYNIGVSGASLNNQTGTAVYENGMWKVGDISFCALLKLENGGTTPSVCSSVG